MNTAEQVEILFNLENFPHGNSITVSAGGSGYVTKLRVLDIQKRPLILTARVVKGDGNSIAVYLSCPYWIVNKAGIPIVCKQEGSSEEAAGQFMEHEVMNINPVLMVSAFYFIKSGSTKRRFLTSDGKNGCTAALQFLRPRRLIPTNLESGCETTW